MTSVEYQTAITALNRLLDEGDPFVLSVQINAPVRRQERRSCAADIDSLFVDSYALSAVLSVATWIDHSTHHTSAPGSTCAPTTARETSSSLVQVSAIP
jgi:hypothetical protein